MTILRWLSVIVSAALLLAVIVVHITSARIVDPVVLRRRARRIGWSVLGSFIFSSAIYAFSVVRSFSIVAAAATPEDKVAVMAAALIAPAAYLRWSINCLFLTLVGLFILRFRAGYNTPAAKP